MSLPNILDVDIKKIAFDNSALVSNVIIGVEKSGIFLVTGENGSGKTTLLRSIVGLIPHVYSKINIEGEIRICGYQPLTAIKKQLVTYVPQVPSSFFLGSTVIQELQLSNTPLEQANEFSTYLNYPIDWLSDGYKYRLLLKTGLSGKQRLILIDEPSSYIDPWIMKEILNEMEEKKKEYGVAFIIADHKEWLYQNKISGIFTLQKYHRVEDKFGNEDEKLRLTPLINQQVLPKISLKNTSFSYTDRNILRNIDLDVSGGEKIVILGKNGVGKTTLLKCVAGMLKCRGNYDVRGKIFFIPHSRIRYFTKNTVMKEIQTHSERTVEQKIVNNLIDYLGLREKLDLNPYNLSIGETRRLFFLLGLISGANILVIDEISLGLDRFYRKKIMQLIELFSSTGGIVVASTHDMELAKNFDRKLLLEDGELVEV